MRTIVLVTALLFALLDPAKADTVVVNQVIDANSVGNGTSSGDYHTPFTLAAGDTLVLNFSFLPGQALSVSNPADIGMQALVENWTTAPFITTLQQNSMSFVGLAGAAHNPSAKADHTDGNALLSFFYPDEFMDAPGGTISFTGVQFMTTVQSYSDGSTSRSYSVLTLMTMGDAVAVISTVPEPAQYGLLLAGLPLLAFAARRRQRR